MPKPHVALRAVASMRNPEFSGGGEACGRQTQDTEHQTPTPGTLEVRHPTESQES